jgi:tetratricopeptide (TPR) repeat protein
MYKARIVRWNLHKNLRWPQKAALVRRIRQTGIEGQLLYNGRPVEHRLRRYCKENKISTANFETAARHSQCRRWRTPFVANSQAEPATLQFQSLFRFPSQPSTPVALYGDIRIAEEIIRNVEMYMNMYFTTGPGIRYYKVDSTLAARNGLHSQTDILVRNEEAWRDIVDPQTMHRHITNAFQAFKNGLIEAAFHESHRALDLIGTVIAQQTPELLAYLISVLIYWTADSSNLAQKIRQFILDMASTVLGKTHPVTTLVNHLCTLSEAVGRRHVWRAATDILDKSFACMEDAEPVNGAQFCYYSGLRGEGFINEAQDYLDVMYSTDGKLEERNSWYVSEKAWLLKMQDKYPEAEMKYRECLQLVEEYEREILAEGSNSNWIGWRVEIIDSLVNLAEILDFTDRIDEANAMWWRALEFDSAAFGPDDAVTHITGSWFDNFLTDHGLLEERAVLRDRCPWLLTRRQIPKEFW